MSRLKKRNDTFDIQIPLTAVGELITARAGEKAGPRAEVTVAIQRYVGGFSHSSAGTGDGEEVDIFGLHFGYRVDWTDRLEWAWSCQK